MAINAEIIKDSINTVTGDRLTTFVLSYPRFIHSEFLVHRAFSRNSSSSRAIPVEKMIARVIEDPAVPVHLGVNQKGMVADVEVKEKSCAIALWLEARDNAVSIAQKMKELGLHKQVVNRILENFSHITTIVTATDYQNFFALRCHPDAQPEIRELAIKMRSLYWDSITTPVAPGNWHIPWVDSSQQQKVGLDDALHISVGRSARVSYLNHQGEYSESEDIALCDRLLRVSPPHISPAEHQAKALPMSARSRNFTGWMQYRAHLEDGVKVLQIGSLEDSNAA